MTKKKAVALNSMVEIENKVRDLKLDLAKEKGMLASKTKSTNPSKKTTLKKQIARLLTKLNALKKKQKEALKKIKEVSKKETSKPKTIARELSKTGSK
jgi:large subunit ribosomal protein L29